MSSEFAMLIEGMRLDLDDLRGRATYASRLEGSDLYVSRLQGLEGLIERAYFAAESIAKEVYGEHS